MKLIILLLTCLLSVHGLGKEKKVIKVAAIDWCPQICPNQDKKGYIFELVQEIYKDSQYELQFSFYSWSRAIAKVRAGEYDLLLSPAKEEAPDLIYPTIPIGQQTHCFWTNKSNKWTYDGIDSLLNERIVIYRDHSYKNILRPYFEAAHQDQYDIFTYDETFIRRASEMVKNNRANSFIFTINSVQHFIKQNSVAYGNRFKVSGCIKKDALWIGLSPKKVNQSNEMLPHIDKKILEFKKNGIYQRIVNKYQIKFPKLFDE